MMPESLPKKPAKLIANFNSYMKTRMDYLADVTTGVPTVENSKWFFNELMAGIDKNRLLLEKISGIDGFHFKFLVRNFVDQKKSENPDCCKKVDSKCTHTIKEGSRNDIMVSIPNDILGFHAFYVILENIIRNTAKHGEKQNISDSNPVCFVIDIMNCVADTAYYEILIYDNMVIPEKRLKGKKVSDVNSIVKAQNIFINKPVLDASYNLRQGGWGILEMEASAAYLRKIPVEDIDTDPYEIDPDDPDKRFRNKEEEEKRDLNILKAVAVHGKYLGYRLFLRKPKELLIIDNGNFYEEISDEKRKGLLNFGILFCRVVDKPSDSIFDYDPQKVYNHKLVAVTVNKNSEYPKVVIDNLTGLSRRLFKLNESVPAPYYEEQSILDFFNSFWTEYLLKTEIKMQFFEKYFALFDNTDFLPKGIAKNESKKANYLNHGKDFESLKNEFDYLEVDTSQTKIFKPLRDSTNLTLKIPFLESCHIPIVIIDERIQEYAANAVYSPETKIGETPIKIKVQDILIKTEVFVPLSTEADLNAADDFLKTTNDIKEYIKTSLTNSIFVIHLGIIEKMMKSEECKIPISEYIEKTFSCFDLNDIVVISGRGQPHNLPAKIRYLNYSVIAQYIIDVRYKYLLSEALLSARRLNK